MRVTGLQGVVGSTGFKCWVLAGLSVLAGCATTANSDIVSSWKAPDAKPMLVQDARVAAVAMVKDPQLRQTAEDQLVKELNARGMRAVSMYRIMPSTDPSQEQAARKALEA